MDVNDFGYYLEYELESPELLQNIRQRIYDLKEYWSPQKHNNKEIHFYTLGASFYTYITEKRPKVQVKYKEYFEAVDKLNPILKSEFNNLHEYLLNLLAEKLSCEVRMTDRFGYPGFHVFPNPMGDGRMHADGHAIFLFDPEEYDFSQIISILIPIEIPKKGAGLNFLSDEEDSGTFNIEHSLDFEIGKVYLFDGLCMHQIRGFEIEGSEARLTMQCHAIKSHKGFWSVFW